jgi:hypothetical protein
MKSPQEPPLSEKRNVTLQGPVRGSPRKSVPSRDGTIPPSNPSSSVRARRRATLQEELKRQLTLEEKYDMAMLSHKLYDNIQMRLQKESFGNAFHRLDKDGSGATHPFIFCLFFAFVFFLGGGWGGALSIIEK